jgi:hypothetical protein
MSRITKPALIAIGIALVSTTAIAADDRASEDKADPNRQICKSITVTGSRMTKRVCRTMAEWKNVLELSPEDAQRIKSASKDKAE